MALPTKIQLQIVSAERSLVNETVDEVEIPGADGYFGVLPGHTPLLALLKVGIMRYRTNGESHSLVISWGFVEVLPERVTVMAETARLPQEIDAAAAESDLVKYEKELADLSSHDPEFAIVEGKLEESVAMINVHRGM